ncbi:MAG: hypothetical protein IPM13_14680 [Phycisphaerales bacterium]|nr:hypothetical protein [Phycisphaerales bacterium]
MLLTRATSALIPRCLGLLGLACLAAPLCGCIGAGLGVAKAAISEIRGAQGKVSWITNPAGGDVRAARSLEIAPATTSVGPLCPGSVLRSFDTAAGRTWPERTQRFPGGPPRLRIYPDVTYFQGKGLMSGALLLARLRLELDGQPAGEALLVVESDAFTAGGEEALTKAAIEAIVRWLSPNANRSP